MKFCSLIPPSIPPPHFSDKQIIEKSPNLRIFEVSNKLTKNLYYQVFLQNCIGDYLVFIDLEENDIDSFLEILTKAREYDIVIGVRKQKIQSLIQKFTSYLFYRYTIREDYSDFCVLNRKVINYLLKEKLDIYLLRLIQFDSRFSKCVYPFIPICNNKKTTFLILRNWGLILLYKILIKHCA